MSPAHRLVLSLVAAAASGAVDAVLDSTSTAPARYLGEVLDAGTAWAGLSAHLVLPSGALAEALLHPPGGPAVRGTLVLLGLTGTALALRRRGR